MIIKAYALFTPAAFANEFKQPVYRPIAYRLLQMLARDLVSQFYVGTGSGHFKTLPREWITRKMHQKRVFCQRVIVMQNTIFLISRPRRV